MKKKNFFSEGLQNYLAFILTGRIYWISKDGSDKKLNRGVIQECYKKKKNLLTSEFTFTPKLIDDYQFSKVDFKGIFLKQDNMSFLHKKVVNLYIT